MKICNAQILKYIEKSKISNNKSHQLEKQMKICNAQILKYIEKSKISNNQESSILFVPMAASFL